MRDRWRVFVAIVAAGTAMLLSACAGGDDDDAADDDAADDTSGDDVTDDDDSGDNTADPDCGDGVCAADEDCLTCAADCVCACGDGLCTLGEFCAVCPDDCDCETLAATPPMGWNSWNRFGCGIDEALVRDTADAMAATGLRDAGYRYLNLDDCWQVGRDENGTIVADPEKFPSGIPALAEYVHERGLKFGLYTCAGTMTCQQRPGSYGYEYRDAATYAAWGVDYVKVDWCFTEGLVPRERYAVFRDAIDEAGGGIILSICDWGVDSPAVWGPGTGQLWRTTGDISDNLSSMLFNMIRTEPLAPFARPGAWNDPDMLEVGNGGMTAAQYRTHMGLWAMMAAPLIAGNDLRAMSEETRAVLTNPEVIAVDQDPAGVAGRRLTRVDGIEAWARPVTLAGARAVLLFNGWFATGTARVEWDEIGLAPETAWVRDLWAREDLGEFDGGFETVLAPFESRLLLVTGAEHVPPSGESFLSALPWKYEATFLGAAQRDTSAGGGPLTIASVPYASGLGVKAASVILYHLGGRCSAFTADVGVDDEAGGKASVVFKVEADGELLWVTDVKLAGDPATRVAVDLTGKRELKLVVTPASDSTSDDHADWADARLFCR